MPDDIRRRMRRKARRMAFIEHRRYEGGTMSYRLFSALWLTMDGEAHA